MRIRLKRNQIMRRLLCLFPLFFLSVHAHELTTPSTEINPTIKTEANLSRQKAKLGKALFFDTNLSKNRAMSCATCHNPDTAFADNRTHLTDGMVSLGTDGKSMGTRNAPTAMYAQFSPTFHFDEKKGEYIGGQFYDGRAATLAEQAGGPPLNPVEMMMPNKAAVIERLRESPDYVRQFKAIYGDDIFNDTEKAYAAMTDAIQAFEQTKTFAPFNSKYDKYLRGEYELSVLEDLGRTLFFSNDNVSCANCHVLKVEDSTGELFTNHQFHNIGTPANQKLIKIAKLAPNFIDHGLLDNPAVTDTKHDGKIKVPTLRNVAITAPYMHNGVFQKLETVVEFYDKYNNPERTLNPETGEPWRDPQVPKTVDLDNLKAKKLNKRKIDALVAFMKLLTDEQYEHLLKE